MLQPQTLLSPPCPKCLQGHLVQNSQAKNLRVPLHTGHTQFGELHPSTSLVWTQDHHICPFRGLHGSSENQWEIFPREMGRLQGLPSAVSQKTNVPCPWCSATAAQLLMGSKAIPFPALTQPWTAGAQLLMTATPGSSINPKLWSL